MIKFPDLVNGQNSLQSLNANNEFGRDNIMGSSNQKLAQSLAVQRNGKDNLADSVNVTSTKNIVHVDFIGAEYMGNGLKGFDKRMPVGYNGSQANIKKKGGENGGDGANDGGGNVNILSADNDGKKTNPKGKKGNDGSASTGILNVGSHLTDEQIRKIMLEDPEAAKFLDGLLP